jgi:replication-associated recombination protein RarA
MEQSIKMKILSKLGNLFTPDISHTQQIVNQELSKEESDVDIFKHIYGHEKLKLISYNALESEESVHILFTGSPGTAKSLFLEAISDNVKHSYFINNNSTGAGIISYLYSNPELQYLLIDEIEKLKKEELAVLLSIMENQRLVITKRL